MNLVYDVSKLSLSWGSVAWMIFFWIFIGFGAFAVPYLVSQHGHTVERGRVRALMFVAVFVNAIFLWWLIDGFVSRQVCVGLVGGDTSSVTGKVSRVSRSSRAGKTYFYVGDTQFTSKTNSPGRECGFTPSVDEVSPLTDGDLLLLEYSGAKILRVWRYASKPVP